MEKNKKHTYLHYALLFLLFTGGGAVAGAAVSYTHLDVYKRQYVYHAWFCDYGYFHFKGAFNGSFERGRKRYLQYDLRRRRYFHKRYSSPSCKDVYKRQALVREAVDAAVQSRP